MSKSYGNTIPLFAGAEQRRRLVARVRTDSRRPDEPKDPETCLVFGLYRQFASEEARESMSVRYRDGGIGYAEAKACLAAAIERELGEAGERFRDLRADEGSLHTVLAAGAARARHAAGATMATVRAAIGTALTR
jgi:tryptophanyl-tRNA synthetase